MVADEHAADVGHQVGADGVAVSSCASRLAESRSHDDDHAETVARLSLHATVQSSSQLDSDTLVAQTTRTTTRKTTRTDVAV